MNQEDAEKDLMSQRKSVLALLATVVDVRASELAKLLWAFFYFYCLLCSYYIIRPIRDAMGIEAGIEGLQYLYLLTMVLMLALVPLFGWLTSRWPRRKFLPFIYLFFISNLLLFYFLFARFQGNQLIGQSFYLWVNVFNLFVVSVFWSFMADIFSDEQAKRLFGFIAAGGSAGAITGPILTSSLIEIVGLQNLLLISAACLLLAIVCVKKISALSVRNPNIHEENIVDTNETLIKGGVWSGIQLVFRSHYLLGICVLMLSYSVLSTFLYFQQVEIIAEHFLDAADRTRMFARVDLAVNVLTILCQLFITGRLIKHLGVGFSLALVPLLLAVGLLVLGLSPYLGISILPVIIVLQVVRRSGYYAIVNPAREMLYVVVSREEKYRAKNFIDTTVYRAGDLLSIGMTSMLRAAGVGVHAIALMTIPIALLWASVSWWLGAKHDCLVEQEQSTDLQK